jgi:hypothetical protein
VGTADTSTPGGASQLLNLDNGCSLPRCALRAQSWRPACLTFFVLPTHISFAGVPARIASDSKHSSEHSSAGAARAQGGNKLQAVQAALVCSVLLCVLCAAAKKTEMQYKKGSISVSLLCVRCPWDRTNSACCFPAVSHLIPCHSPIMNMICSYLQNRMTSKQNVPVSRCWGLQGQ